MADYARLSDVPNVTLVNRTLTVDGNTVDIPVGGGGGGGSGGVDTNAVIDIANATIATNATIRHVTNLVVYAEDVAYGNWSYHTQIIDLGDEESDWVMCGVVLCRYLKADDITWLEEEDYHDDYGWAFTIYGSETSTGGFENILEDVFHVSTDRSAVRIDLESDIYDFGYATRTSTPVYVPTQDRIAKTSDIQRLTSNKRDLSDNTCIRNDGLGEWVAHGLPSGITLVGQPGFNAFVHEWMWRDSEGDLYIADEDQDAVYGTFNGQDFNFEATRSAVCTSNELYTTKGYVDKSISTNNPAFVSAVQSISPPSSPTLRLYDEVRGCWWIGRMVNGIISWEVED